MPHIKFPCLLTYWENWGHKGYNVSICSPSLRDLSTEPLILTFPCSTWGMRALVFKFNLLEPASPWPLVGWNSPSPLIYFPMQMKILIFLPLKKKKNPPLPTSLSGDCDILLCFLFSSQVPEHKCLCSASMSSPSSSLGIPRQLVSTVLPGKLLWRRL